MTRPWLRLGLVHGVRTSREDSDKQTDKDVPVWYRGDGNRVELQNNRRTPVKWGLVSTMNRDSPVTLLGDRTKVKGSGTRVVGPHTSTLGTGIELSPFSRVTVLCLFVHHTQTHHYSLHQRRGKHSDLVPPLDVKDGTPRIVRSLDLPSR